MNNSSSPRLFWIFWGIVSALLVATLQFILYPWESYAFLGLSLLIPVFVVIWIHPYWVILFLTLFMPFESFMLKFIPGPEQIYFASQFASEFILYLTFGIVLLKLFLAGKHLRKTPIDIPVAIFLIGAILSILYNHSPWMGSVVNLRAILRYLVLYYLIINFKLNSDQTRSILRAVLLAGFLEIVIGLTQLLGGSAIKSLFLPRQSTLSAFGRARDFIMITRGREMGSIFGTLGDTLLFGLFMLVVLAVFLSLIKRLSIRNSLAIVVIIIIVGYSYSRAALAGVLVVLFAWYVIFYRPASRPLVGMGLFFFMAFGVLVAGNLKLDQLQYINPRFGQVNIVGNLTSVFSKTYFETAKKQRLGSILWVPPIILRESPILGYGPDRTSTITRLAGTELSSTVYNLNKGFEDVYWVAILSYYGLTGLLALAWVLGILIVKSWRIYRHSEDPLVQSLAIAAFLLAVLTPFLLFFDQVLEIRPYSFYLWLFSALMFSLYSPQPPKRSDSHNEFLAQP